MDRLTSNKEVSEMNMLELAHNGCYAKDGCAWYRDYDTDIDARRLAIELLERFADTPNEFTCDDDFDNFMRDALQDGLDDAVGLIAVFYRNLWTIADLRERLAEYEDLDEQRKLIKLPVAVGDTVYTLERPCEVPYDCGYDCKFCDDFKLYISKTSFVLDMLDDVGNTVFATREAAEAALKEMKGNA